MIKLMELLPNDTNNVAGVFLLVKKKLLVLHKHNNTLDIPKGHIQKHETPVQGASREMAEETGITLPEYTLHPLGVKQLEANKKFYMFYHRTNTDYEVSVSDEHSGYEYIEINKLRTDLMWSHTMSFLKTLER